MERNTFISKELQIRNSTVYFLVFTRDAGEDGIEVRVQNGDVWLTQKAIFQLFDVDRSVVIKHLSDIFKEGEIDENSTCANFAQVADKGKHIITSVVIKTGRYVNMRDSIENISQLQKQLNDLQLENQMLKNILDNAGLLYHKELSALKQSDTKEAYAPEQGKRIIPPPVITENMANQFFGMFWGRQDVYAKRSVNKENGKAAYYPQCNNFWTNVCHKKKKDGVSCKDCRNRSYKEITKREILNHLQGNAYNESDVIGVYPLLSNGTCRFMVFDFDNHNKGAEEKDFANVDDIWIEEVEAMREICVLNGIEPLIERSRSGRGAHVWIFFDKPIAASLVRKFGFALLDKGAEQVNLKSFKYYDRMLPAQESLPDNGTVGNLIALPLQGKALLDGNSAFVDGNWNAYPNQWEILFSKPKLTCCAR